MRTQVITKTLETGLLLVLAAACAYAGQTDTVKAKVPFAFFVGDMSLPAGDYTFLPATNGAMRIHDKQAWVATYSTAPEGSSGLDGMSKLVFHRYGDHYFLSQVFNGTKGGGRKLPVSKLEKDYIGASHSTAENMRQREVVVAAH